MARPLNPLLRHVSVTVPPSLEDAVHAWLEVRFGQVPSIYTDAATGLSTVSVYPEIPPARLASTRREIRASLAELAAAGMDVDPARIGIRSVPAKDWSESWKRHFRPIEVGPSLLVKPTWSRRRPRKGQAVVVLDPGLSFGTGQHATTRFCLEQVAANRPQGTVRSFLDIGTGSGILAIAAARLGYTPVAAFDFDPDCVRTAIENAALNGVSEAVQPALADITKAPRRPAVRHDVVCANLIHDLLVSERDRILARVTEDGSLVLAGILKTQFAAVEKAYVDAGWNCVRSKGEREWRSGLFRRTGSR
jgi:ribosomal protein L11 methyltransferase